MPILAVLRNVKLFKIIVKKLTVVLSLCSFRRFLSTSLKSSTLRNERPWKDNVDAFRVNWNIWWSNYSFLSFPAFSLWSLCLQRLLHFNSFREVEVSYITAICCPLFNNGPIWLLQAESTGFNIFLVIILLYTNVFLLSLQCKECWTFDLFIPCYIIYLSWCIYCISSSRL